MNSVTAWEKGILDDKSGGSHLYFYRGGIGCADQKLSWIIRGSVQKAGWVASNIDINPWQQNLFSQILVIRQPVQEWLGSLLSLI